MDLLNRAEKLMWIYLIDMSRTGQVIEQMALKQISATYIGSCASFK